MLSRKLRFGLIGCGVIAPTHATVLTRCENAELVAVCDTIEERAQKLAAEFGVQEVYTDYQRMLEQENIDAVSICTPHYLHAPMCVAAAACGKHVLVEKPMAISQQDCQDMIDACKRAGVRLGVCFQHRFNYSTREIVQAVKTGQMGKLLFAAAQVYWYRSQEYYDGDAWRGYWATEGGGVLINQAIHSLDLLLHLLGPVDGVLADVATINHDIEVEDVATVVLHFSSGTRCVFSATNCAFPGFAQRLELFGDRASVIVEGTQIKEWIKQEEGRAVKVDVAPGECGEFLGKRYYGTGHAPLIEEFVDAVLADRDPYVCGEEGKRAIQVIEAIYRSARSGSYTRII